MPSDLPLAPTSHAELTLLVENSVYANHLLAEHGLSYWIRLNGRAVLFDTGMGAVLGPNAERLSIPLETTEVVFLSHGHCDHVGGLEGILPRCGNARVVTHPRATEPKFSYDAPGKGRFIGTDFFTGRRHEVAGRVVQYLEGPVELIPGLWTTGEIPQVTAYEDTGGPFTLDREGQVPDPLVDDQALFFRVEAGIVVVLGCAHAGVVNTLLHIRQLVGDLPFELVLGGMHLLRADWARLNRTVEVFRELGVRQVAPIHCSGFAARDMLKRAWEEDYLNLSVGSRLTW